MRTEKIPDRFTPSKGIWRPVLLLAVLVAVLLSGACAGIPEAPPPDYVPAPRSVFGGLALSVEDAEALARSLDAAAKRLPAPANASQGLAGVLSLRGILRDAGTPDEIRAKVAEAFDPWTAGTTEGQALVTGYYEPVVDGSLAPSERFRYPLYAVPDDLVTVSLLPFGLTNASRDRLVGRLAGRTVVPYYTRREIDSGSALAGKGLELAWLDDPAEGFFLHVQGSGVVRLPDGPPRRIGYAGSNGHPYRSIGRLLADEGKIPLADVTMQAIRDYLARNPDERDKVLHHNESYVFFRWTEGGPFGSLGAKLVQFASVAVDPRVYPPGSILLLETEIPAPDGGAARPFRSLVVAMDTGGAIRGPGRVDLFCGTGKEAGEIAGRLKSRGKIYLLRPRGQGPPRVESGKRGDT
ncbi:MAG: MltA domain-containing protein [Nitrospirae bacterium]|nr:MltA domain-containing protein [Nitrospirota bacterium]